MSDLLLPDGRNLAYAEFGDPHGKPVFFFHGMPGSRFFHPPDKITQRVGVRLITTDRPGYGRSSFQPGRRILDWPADITQLANRLGLERFYVAGHSGGGPYVASCAYALHERIHAAVVLSGVGPIVSPELQPAMTTMNRFGLWVGPFLPWPLWRLLIWLVFQRRAADPAGDIRRGNGRRPPADDEQFRNPDVRATCIRSEEEAFRTGLRGLAWDARLLTRPWGFPLEEIRLPYYLWHGTQDDQTPLAMARAISGKIPGCKITVCENEGHLLLFPHWEEILTQLISE